MAVKHKITNDLTQYIVKQKCPTCGQLTSVLLGGVCEACYQKRKKEQGNGRTNQGV